MKDTAYINGVLVLFLTKCEAQRKPTEPFTMPTIILTLLTLLLFNFLKVKAAVFVIETGFHVGTSQKSIQG